MRQRKAVEISRQSHQVFDLMFDSGDGPHGDYPGNTFVVQALGWRVSFRLPDLIQPAREKIVAQTWNAATVARMGRDWYWEYHRREFGVYLTKSNHFVIKYGEQTDSWPGDKTWSCFLPWGEWHRVEQTIYGRGGELWWTETKADIDKTVAAGGHGFDGYFAASKLAPAVSFLFVDYDGEVIEARTIIEGSRYRAGEGWFKWIHWFRKDRVYRSLKIEFSKQVGPEKGSWKGGTLGHGIEIEDRDESHEEAFRRYCLEHGLSFYARVDQ